MEDDQRNALQAEPIFSASSAPSARLAESQDMTWVFEDKMKQDFTAKWYAGMILAFTALMLLAIFLIKSWSFAVLLVVLAFSLIAYIRRPSQQVHYSLGNEGIFIDTIHRSLDGFKAFSLVQNLDGRYSIYLIPTKRFSPSLVVDFPTDRGEDIVDFLGARLPMQKFDLTAIDKIIQKLGL